MLLSAAQAGEAGLCLCFTTSAPEAAPNYTTCQRAPPRASLRNQVEGPADVNPAQVPEMSEPPLAAPLSSQVPPSPAKSNPRAVSP